MDTPLGNDGENDPLKEASAPCSPSSISQDKSAPDAEELPESSPSHIQDIEFGSRSMLHFDFFPNVKDFFEISTVEYFDRCFTALYPYLCISFSTATLLKTLRTFATTRRFSLRGTMNSLAGDSHICRTGSDDTIKLSLEEPESKGEPSVGFDRENEAEPPLGAPSSCLRVLSLRQGSKWFRTLRSMTQFPDLYAPFCVNLMASASLFFSGCLAQKLGSRHSLLTLSVLYELSFLSMSCTLLMALCIFLCRYLFTRELKPADFASFFCVCGYTQIPLALMCKVCIVISMFMFLHPLHYVLVVLKVFTYFYLFVSTSCTLFIALPPLGPGGRDLGFKLLAILGSYATQAIFLTLIQKYIH